MTARLHMSTPPLETPVVRLNPGSQTGPFAVVELTPDSLTWVTFSDPAEPEAWAAAFAEAARLLREAQAGQS